VADKRRARGNAYQDKIEKWLVARGWSVHNQNTVSRAIPMKGKVVWVSARNDILAMDLVAVKPGRKTLFVQTTMDTGVAKRATEAAAIGWELQHQDIMLFQKTDPRITVIQQWDGAAYNEVGRIIGGNLYVSKPGGWLEL